MHGVLHRFRTGIGTGSDIMELKLAQELDSIYQDPLLLVFLDLRKAYNTVDQDRRIIALEGYGAGPWLCGLLEAFWEYHQVVPRQNGFHVPDFPTMRGTTQGGLMSLTLFNVVVDNVIRTWLDIMVEDQRVAHDGLGDTIGRCLGVFYANDGMVGSRDLGWMQHKMKNLVVLFRRYGLASNVTKSCTMTCQPGALRVGVSAEATALKCTGVGYSYLVRL